MDAVTEPHEVRWSRDYPAIAGISFRPETGSIVLDIVGVTDAEAAGICRELRDSSDLKGITVAYISYGEDSSIFPS
ncbi:hypothetical protein [Nocardioides sp.]|uniref:hypothetical protein n=1 Tax=Nocardioides sp. TaxID=35761 RepID=UPI001A348437|nr:hypothetical protein [Nocardioides sp.]MBJ7358204.1 hypothetical protein [Nocardioides sp.]